MRNSLLVFLAAFAAFNAACRNSKTEKSESTAVKVVEAPAPAEPENAEPARAPNSAAGIAAVTKGLPLYPNGKNKLPEVWSAPGQFAAGKWGSTYEADTPDAMENVLKWYEKEMTSRGWEAHPSFKGMMSFEKKGLPGKMITLASGPDQKMPGQTLVRVLVLDK